MKLLRTLRPSSWVLALAALLVTSTPRAIGSPPPESPKADCGFSNPYWSGWCRTTVPIPNGATPRGVCEARVRCLNDDGCRNRINLCNQPGIPNNWKLEEARPAATPTPGR